jgi:hypothetical protein
MKTQKQQTTKSKKIVKGDKKGTLGGWTGCMPYHPN